MSHREICERGTLDFQNDVRDQYFRVTTDSGLEAFWPAWARREQHEATFGRFRAATVRQKGRVGAGP